MVQPQNPFFFITSMVVPRGTAAPVLLKWFVGRDVPIGAPSSSGTIIPIPTSPLPSLVYLHSRGFRSMDEAKGRVLVGAFSPILLPNRSIGRSSETKAKASFCSVLLLHFLILGSMGDLSYPESFRGVLCVLFPCTLILPYSNGHGRLAIGLEARSLAFPPHHLLEVVHGDYRKALMNMNLSHGGVCIFIIGVISSSTRKIQFTQRLPLGSELHMGKERCCLRGLDPLHGPTFHSIRGNLMIYKPFSSSSLPRFGALRSLTNSFMFEHDESLRAIMDIPLPIHFSSYGNGKLAHFLHRERSWWSYNRGHKSFWLTMFPEKRYFFSIQETTSTTKAAIHTNPLTDPYAPIGTGSFETGGWYTTMMKPPLILRIRIGFLLAPLGGLHSLLRQLQKDKLHRNRIPVGS
uniref:Cytochrome c biogenesis FC n=2 Tax=Araucaria TaxID=25666 RepID=A0A0N7AS52_ARAHE|nr:cytochrome c biogenesis FC [Araucaria heterophylla]QJH91742.1 cytochrome c maturation subunit FC [Araucaria heterophylla]QXE43716.1 cytochrome c biogenesis FC [Araucaria cunninghamii]